MLDKYRLDQITKDTLELLVTESAAESRRLDFKTELPGSRDSEKKEFAADVASFANSGGGDVVFGVTEAGGRAAEVRGVACTNADKEILRLQEMALRGVDPRVDGLEFRAVAGFRLGPVIVMRVPRSWNAPHMVTACGAESRFHARFGAQKTALDVHQIRAAFLGSHEVSDRVRRFRDERLGRILGDETPFRLRSPRRLVVHLVPFSSMDPTVQVDLTRAAGDTPVRLRPIGAGGWDHRYNLDGFATYAGGHDGASGYVQVFRRGMIEAVDVLETEWGRCLGHDEEPVPVIPGASFARETTQSVWEYLEAVKHLGQSLPVAVFLSLTGVRSMELYVGPRYTIGAISPLDRETILLPEVLFEEHPRELASVLDKLRPAFDALWQASGYRAFFMPGE